MTIDWFRTFLMKLIYGHNGEKPLRVIERETEEATRRVKEGTQTIRKVKRAMSK